jgi:hypothetical protein
MKVKVKDYADLVTTSAIMDVPVGSGTACEGAWQVDRKYGNQFVVERWKR